MVRWITFDDQTAAAVVSNVASGTAEIRDGDALLTALHEGDCTLLLPAQTPDHVLFLRIRVNASSRKPAASVKPEPEASYEAVGFLGLSDSPVFEEEPAKPTKWWEKLLG